MSIATRWNRVCEEVTQTCIACGRDPREVQIIAVSKTVGEEGVAEAVGAGVLSFGENRPDALLPKASAFPQATWHFIGNVQSRRIADIVSAASYIHSLYQAHHLTKTNEAAAKLQKVQNILLEVNVSGEESKGGASPQELRELIELTNQLSHLRLCGLMTMAPQGDKLLARACFNDLARLLEETRPFVAVENQPFFNELSMGMSEDWQEAVAAGTTMVRIGRAIFSDDFEND